MSIISTLHGLALGVRKVHGGRHGSLDVHPLSCVANTCEGHLPSLTQYLSAMPQS